MKTLTAACVVLLLVCSLADASRPLGQPLQLFGGDGAGAPRRQLQALNKTQATSVLKVVADLAGEIKSLDLGSELDNAVSEVDLAKFLVSSLAGLGVPNKAINSVLTGGTVGKLTSQGASTDSIIKSVVQGLQTLLDEGTVTNALDPILTALGGGVLNLGFIRGYSQLLNFKAVFKGFGLPLDSATLKTTVNVNATDRALVRLVAITINDYIKLANALAATATSSSSTAGTQAAANALVGKVTSLLG